MLNYVLGPILFIILALAIYIKIKNQPNLRESWSMLKASLSVQNKWYVFTLFSLMLLNWGIEARKWQILVSSVQKVSFFTAAKAVLSGLSFSLFIPNGIGEYFGRVVYMNEGNRLRSVALTIVGSISQVIITLLGGLAGLLYLKNFTWQSTAELEGLSVFWVNSIIS